MPGTQYWLSLILVISLQDKSSPLFRILKTEIGQFKQVTQNHKDSV